MPDLDADTVIALRMRLQAQRGADGAATGRRAIRATRAVGHVDGVALVRPPANVGTSTILTGDPRAAASQECIAVTLSSQDQDVDPQAGAFAQSTCRALDGDEDRRKYHDYQFRLIAPHCGRSVLEIGAGTGALSSRFGNRDRRVVTDVDPEAVEHLSKRFADQRNVEVRALNLAAGDVLTDPVDTAIAVNVLEHIDDDVGALRMLARSVRHNGTLVLWVPGYDWLYGDFDRKVGHVRRYTPELLGETARRAGLTVTLCRPVNLLGALAWWAAVRKGGTGSPRPRMVRLYDRVIVPLTRALERFWIPPFGQSILCVARVPTSADPAPPAD